MKQLNKIFQQLNTSNGGGDENTDFIVSLSQAYAGTILNWAYRRKKAQITTVQVHYKNEMK